MVWRGKVRGEGIQSDRRGLVKGQMENAKAADGQPGLSAGPQSCMVWQPSDKLSQVNQQHSMLDRAESDRAFRSDRVKL